MGTVTCADVACAGLLCSGIQRRDLDEAGARAVYRHAADLLAHLERGSVAADATA
ncbi:hypothetical protein [Streptomyces sp. NPDC056480]|uniref:hypothetical protein n=1 Tax=Streptomyces sp. NPDC056480 TaxID=3345833 RepID=UPI0036990283